MSEKVTFGQAKRLKKLGFNIPTRDYYEASGFLITQERSRFPLKEMCNSKLVTECSAPTVSQALDWVREEKRVRCAVDVDYFDGWYYTGKYQDMTKTDFRYTDSFDDHPLASSALLDAVLTYLEQKEKK